MMLSPKFRFIAIAAVAIALGIFLFLRFRSTDPGSDQKRSGGALVRVGTPARETVVQRLDFTGDVLAIQQANIFAKVSGTLDQVSVDMGRSVRRGELLALIDTTELYQQYQQALATYQNARITYTRTNDLFGQNLVSKQDLDNAEASMKVAAAAYDGAKVRLGYAHIIAPFSGIVTRRFLDPGTYVSSTSATLFTLMDLDNVKVIINVQEKDLSLVSDGKETMVAVDAYPGKTFTGKVKRSSQALDPATRAMPVEIDIPNTNHMLKPGMYANVSLVVDTHPNAISVPSSALLKDNLGPFVYVVIGDTARIARVTTGTDMVARMEIVSGLTGHESIVTTGQQFIRNGSPVTVQQ